MDPTDMLELQNRSQSPAGRNPINTYNRSVLNSRNEPYLLSDKIYQLFKDGLPEALQNEQLIKKEQRLQNQQAALEQARSLRFREALDEALEAARKKERKSGRKKKRIENPRRSSRIAKKKPRRSSRISQTSNSLQKKTKLKKKSIKRKN